jgi:tetratricopeptide (TPR) repeat protein
MTGCGIMTGWKIATGWTRRATRPLGVVATSAMVAALVASRPCVAQVPRDLIGRAVPDDVESREIAAAIGRFRDRDIEGCRKLLEQARAANPKLPPPGVMMAMLWLNVNQVGPARVELETAVVSFPEDPEPYLMLGDLAFRDRRITDAAVLFERAADLIASFTENPRRKRDFEIRSAAGNAAVAESRRQWERAEQLLARWLELDPDSAGAHQRMGIALFRLGRRDDALAEFREARKLDEKAVYPELALARLHDDTRQFDVARELVASALAAAPDDATVQLGAAQWYLGRGDLAAAARAADAALRLDPRSLEAKLARGTIARMAGDDALAEAQFSDALTQAPGTFPASNALALVLAEKEDDAARRRALEMAETNAALHRDGSPHQIAALTTLAWASYRLGRRQEAEKILEQISRNNALTPDGAYYVARLLADRGERDRARRILEQVLDKEPMFPTRPDAVDLLEQVREPAP